MNMSSRQIKPPAFKFVLYQGNNSTVIQEAIAARRVWTQVPISKILSANFVWKPLDFPSTIYNDVDQILRYQKDHHVLLNHFQNNNLISSKSGLVRSLKHYYSHENGIYAQNYHVFETIPTTFIVNPGKQTGELKDFLQRFAQLQMKNYIRQKIPAKHCQNNVWYIKPESANQGKGITLTNSLKEIESIIHSKSLNTFYILQKAVEKPLLYKGRKFDVRVWALVTSQLQIYWYKVPYIRTSSFLYDEKDLSELVHLTNNFQQKKNSEYSKYQQGNTIPFQSLREQLQSQGKTDIDELMNKITQRIKALIIDCILSVRKLFLRNVKKKEFELFGFDFLIDQDLRTWLIEVNSNPSLGTPNKFIKQLMPNMINQMFEIILDPVFPPSNQYRPVINKNFQILHKQINFYRINPLRSGSTDNKRKNYYPMNNEPQKNSSVHKNRRNSQALSGLHSFESAEKHLKVRYSTPIETIKYLLDTYCFNDLEPFLVPVNFLLTSPKLKEAQSLSANLKNLKLITETRICHILLQTKFLIICKQILNSDEIDEEVKISILTGYFNAIRTHKNRVDTIRNVIPTFKQIIKTHKEAAQEEKDPMIESMIMLLIRLGGSINRKIFIPGQSREKQTSRQFFITSNALTILMYFKDTYPQLCKTQVSEFFENLNSKDWQLYEMSQKTREGSVMSQSVPQTERNKTQTELDQKFSINVKINEDKKRKTSYSQKFDVFSGRTLGTVLPKIRK